VLEDEKVLGTCHIALGNNLSLGGSVDAPLHLDGVLKKPTIRIDGRLIMKDGGFLI
jgi:leucyl aminopeptidase (aminopeptidase T)